MSLFKDTALCKGVIPAMVIFGEEWLLRAPTCRNGGRRIRGCAEFEASLALSCWRGSCPQVSTGDVDVETPDDLRVALKTVRCNVLSQQEN
jgi:hypothetical protein